MAVADPRTVKAANGWFYTGFNSLVFLIGVGYFGE
jgi:hypothetical protein